MTKLSYIEGIGPVYEGKLMEAGVKSMEDLLETCASKKGRADLAERSGISEKLILTWANHADLNRIKGIGSQYSDLLEEAGVDTVPDLARRNAENLYQKIMEINEERNLVRNPPSLKQIQDWIDQAGKLPRIMEY